MSVPIILPIAAGAAFLVWAASAKKPVVSTPGKAPGTTPDTEPPAPQAPGALQEPLLSRYQAAIMGHLPLDDMLPLASQLDQSGARYEGSIVRFAWAIAGANGQKLPSEAQAPASAAIKQGDSARVLAIAQKYVQTAGSDLVASRLVTAAGLNLGLPGSLPAATVPSTYPPPPQPTGPVSPLPATPPPKSPPVKAPPSPTGAQIPVDAHMPAAMVQELIALLATTTDAAELDAFALVLERAGYPVAAQTVRAAAAELRAKGAGSLTTTVTTILDSPPDQTTTLEPPTYPPTGSAPPVAPQGVPYVIQSGDLPYLVAHRMTRNANRWREILPLNPGMKTRNVANKNGTTTTLVEPWKVGSTIRIPASWLATALSPPATVPVSPPTTPPASTYTIKSGDLPYLVAQRLTGDAGRWRELLKPNGLKVRNVKNKNGTTTTLVEPWKAGQVLQLPAGWRAS